METWPTGLVPGREGPHRNYTDAKGPAWHATTQQSCAERPKLSPEESHPMSQLSNKRGKAALDRLYRGHRGAGPGLLFLDFDDVICTSSPYGGYDLFSTDGHPADLFERLWHPPAVDTLLSVLAEHQPRVVITTSWLRLMERDGFEPLLHRTGLSAVAAALHVAWEAPALRDMTRHGAIDAEWIMRRLWRIRGEADPPGIVRLSA